MLRNDEKPRITLHPHELPEVSRHGRLVMRHEDAAIACGTGKHFLVGEACQPCCRSRSEVDRGHAPQHGRHDDLIQIRVGLKADWHSAREGGVLLGLS